MDPDNAPELTTRKPRTTGKLVWLRQDGDALTAIAQPEHADIAAASVWMRDQVQTEALPAGVTYALHRAICTATPRVEVARKAVW